MGWERHTETPTKRLPPAPRQPPAALALPFFYVFRVVGLFDEGFRWHFLDRSIAFPSFLLT